ncbi:MAG TPA: DUF4340 domain-containing protein [Chloroflexia bacterium]|nr:DUF4340 domain-containing protein [Chloroflexia bacterium]
MERYRTTIIMVALLLVLGGVAIFLTNQNKLNPPGVTPTPVPSYLWQETSQVQGIDVMSGTAKVSLRKDISTTLWMLTAPEQYPADKFQVDNVAGTLQSIEATKVATGTTDLAQYGLDKSGMSVTVTFSSTTPISHTLLIGAQNFDGTGFYIKQVDSPDVYLSATTPIGTIQNWLLTPPKEAPTPTPFPTAPPTPTSTATAEPSPAGPVGPPSNASPGISPSVEASVVVTGTAPIVAPPTIAATGPGAANSTTPLVPTATATTTP